MTNITKEQTKKFYEKAQKIGFWIIIVLLIGFASGQFVAKKQFETQIRQAEKLGGIYIGEKVFDIRIRP